MINAQKANPIGQLSVWHFKVFDTYKIYFMFRKKSINRIIIKIYNNQNELIILIEVAQVVLFPKLPYYCYEKSIQKLRWLFYIANILSVEQNHVHTYFNFLLYFYTIICESATYYICII